MSDEHIEPMDEALAQLLARGAPPLVAPPDGAARLRARLSSAVPGFDGGGKGGGGSTAGGASKLSGAAGLTIAGGVVLAIVVGGAALLATSTSREGSGSATTATIASTPVPSMHAASASASASSLPDAVPVESLPTVTAPSIADAAATPRATAAAPSSSTTATTTADTLHEERAVLDEARAALARGDASAAESALERHASRWPTGRLAEERDALRIRTLASLGRRGEAEARAARFREEHPNSLFSSAVDEVVPPSR